MWTFIGLGNPGSKYAKTKHNFGFWIIDRLAQKYDLSFKSGRGPYIYAKHFDQFLLVKPTTYMNDSGRGVTSVRQFFNIVESEILVVYDELDLPLGSIRFRAQGSSGGHKGMTSIIQGLNTDQFPRLRVGIGTSAHMRPAEKYVLTPFRASEENLKSEVLDKAVDGLEYLLSHSISETMNSFNIKPEKNEKTEELSK